MARAFPPIQYGRVRGFSLSPAAPGLTPKLWLFLALGLQSTRFDGYDCNRLPHPHHSTGVEVNLPILLELARELARVPREQMMLLAHGTQAKGYGAASFGNWFRERCVEAGLPHCTAHGLRKAGARRLAEAGATENELAAFLAHSSTREAARYTAAANRSKLTDSAMAKLSTEPA